jgi:hypothetical protein
MQLENENLISVAKKCAEKAKHFHISRPELAPVRGVNSLISNYGNQFIEAGYKNYFSVEMRDAGFEAVEQIFEDERN